MKLKKSLKMNKKRVTYHISHFINIESGIICSMKANFAALTTKNHKIFWNKIVKYCYCDWSQFTFCEVLFCELEQILPTIVIYCYCFVHKEMLIPSHLMLSRVLSRFCSIKVLELQRGSSDGMKD